MTLNMNENELKMKMEGEDLCRGAPSAKSLGAQSWLRPPSRRWGPSPPWLWTGGAGLRESAPDMTGVLVILVMNGTHEDISHTDKSYTIIYYHIYNIYITYIAYSSMLRHVEMCSSYSEQLGSRAQGPRRSVHDLSRRIDKASRSCIECLLFLTSSRRRSSEPQLQGTRRNMKLCS